MDEILEQVVEFATSVSYDTLPGHAVAAAKERLLDSIGCTVGAWGAVTAEIGRQVAATAGPGGLTGRVVGSGETFSAASAAFVNGCLVRDLDFNDTYPGGHPSDGLAALFAVAGARDTTGRDLITATVICYETFIRLQMAAKLREKGWDNGYGIGIGAAAALSRLLGLDRQQTRHAIAITATANVPMRATRAGMLSMWKGAATAFAVQNAVAATELAAAGMTGPEAPFTGRHGLCDLITGPLELRPFGTAGGDYYIGRAKIKYWPVVYNMQALVWAAIQLRESLAGRAPAEIEVFTYWSAWHESGSEPAKWDPRTRETADHSLPYILAWTLRHGSVDHQAFESASFLDPVLRPVMDIVKVSVDDEIESVFPETVRMRVRAVDDAGREHVVEVENPLGHEKNPVSAADLDAKFLRLCTPRLGADRAEAAVATWRGIETRDVRSALDAVDIVADRAPVH